MNLVPASSVQVHPSILCVGDGWFPQRPGGLNRYVYELLHTLAATGDRIELCGVGLPETEADSPFTLTNLASPQDAILKRLLSARARFSQTREMKPDAVNLHFALYGLPLLSNLPSDCPITFTFHGPWALESERETTNKLSIGVKRWVEQRVYRQCDRFIVLSHAFGDILHQHFQVPWDQIHIIPGGVDIQRFQPHLSQTEAREILGWSRDRFILFTPRRLVARMGIDRLLTALASLRSKHSDIWLAIAGKGPLRDSLERQARELELDHQVQFLGYLPDDQLPIAYQAADLTVVPSVALEGFGLILLESLASGTPVLCTPVGGMPEVLAQFSPQLIAPSPDAHALASCLDDIMLQRLALPSRIECRTYAISNFDWSIIADKVRRVLLT